MSIGQGDKADDGTGEARRLSSPSNGKPYATNTRCSCAHEGLRGGCVRYDTRISPCIIVDKYLPVRRMAKSELSDRQQTVLSDSDVGRRIAVRRPVSMVFELAGMRAY